MKLNGHEIGNGNQIEINWKCIWNCMSDTWLENEIKQRENWNENVIRNQMQWQSK